VVQLLPATDGVDLYVRFSTDGGATYDATGYNYAWSKVSDSGTATGGGSGSANQIVIASSGAGVGNASTEGYCGTVELHKQTSTALWCRITHSGYFIDAQATPAAHAMTGGGAREAAQDTDALRFLFSSGNITSGIWAAYGML
jgi:hypothetical protein